MEIRRHWRDAVVQTMTAPACSDDGWAQRAKRRKYRERMNFEAVAMSARTLLDLTAAL